MGAALGYSTNAGDGWVDDDLWEDFFEVGAIALAADGSVRVIYVAGTRDINNNFAPGPLWSASNATGGWEREEVDPDTNIYFPTLAMSADGHLHAMYEWFDEEDLRYAER